MIDTPASPRPATSAALERARKARDRRILFFVAVATLLFGIAVATFAIFRNLANADLVSLRQLYEQLQSERQNLRHQVTTQAAQLTTLQAKLASVQAELEAIVPTSNTYSIEPNQSRLIGDGKLTIALVGSPGNDSITLNINGKPQTAAAGQAITIAPDPQTSCQVAVQSFDMFRALLTAVCHSTKTP